MAYKTFILHIIISPYRDSHNKGYPTRETRYYSQYDNNPEIIKRIGPFTVAHTISQTSFICLFKLGVGTTIVFNFSVNANRTSTDRNENIRSEDTMLPAVIARELFKIEDDLYGKKFRDQNIRPMESNTRLARRNVGGIGGQQILEAGVQGSNPNIQN